MITGLQLGPRAVRDTDKVCTMPANPDAGVYTEQPAAALTLNAVHDRSDFVQWCNAAFKESFQKSLRAVYKQGYSGLKDKYLEEVNFPAPQRLMLHELSHGKNAFGEYVTGNDKQIFTWRCASF